MPPVGHSFRHAILFNSPEFVLAFLPGALTALFVAGRIGGSRWMRRVLVAASLFFYGWWNPRFVLLLVGSILGNYALGRRILPGWQPASSPTWHCSAGSNCRSQYFLVHAVKNFWAIPRDYRYPGRSQSTPWNPVFPLV